MLQPVQQALAVAQEAQKQINSLLTGVDQGTNLLSINTHFRQIEARLSFMGAVVEPGGESFTPQKDQFPPITDFMGEKMEVSQVSIADLNPIEAEKKKFVDKVDKLMGLIVDLTVEDVLKNYVSPNDQFVLRGVAKKAGVKDYDRAEINEGFVTAIKEAVAKSKGQTALQAKVDDNSTSQQKQQELEKLVKERTDILAKIEVHTKEIEASKASVTDKTSSTDKAKSEAKQQSLLKLIDTLEERQLEIEEILEVNKIEY